MKLKLLSAILIYFNDHPDLAHRMKEAAKTIEREAVRADGMLCGETVRAILKYKKGRK